MICKKLKKQPHLFCLLQAKIPQLVCSHKYITVDV